VPCDVTSIGLVLVSPCILSSDSMFTVKIQACICILKHVHTLRAADWEL
jgi:hypothetical protein